MGERVFKIDPVIQAMMPRVERDFREWNFPKQVEYTEHDRPFYQTSLEYGVNNELPKLHGLSCGEWIELKLREKGEILVLDICCGTGHAAQQIEEQNSGVISYGLTGSTFYEERTGKSVMRLKKERLIIGNVAHLQNLMDKCVGGLKFDVIYSFQGLPYVPLPCLYMIQQIYPLLESDGVAFLEHWHGYSLDEVMGLDELKGWLMDNGYDFEFSETRGTKINTVKTPKSAFRKTHPELILPIKFTPEGLSVFNDSLTKPILE